MGNVNIIIVVVVVDCVVEFVDNIDCSRLTNWHQQLINGPNVCTARHLFTSYFSSKAVRGRNDDDDDEDDFDNSNVNLMEINGFERQRWERKSVARAFSGIVKRFQQNKTKR